MNSVLVKWSKPLLRVEGITYLPVPQAGVEFMDIGKIRMGVFGLEEFKKEKFTDLPIVIPLLPTEGTPSKVMGIDDWPEHKFERKVNYRVTSTRARRAAKHFLD